MTAYLIDTNVFIHAKNVHYGFDFCPAFRDWLETRNGFGQVASVDEVAVELRRKRDDSSQWAEARGRGFFLKPDTLVQRGMSPDGGADSSGE